MAGALFSLDRPCIGLLTGGRVIDWSRYPS